MSRVTKIKILVALPFLSASWFLVTVIWAGFEYENYSHVSQFISELGATGSSTGTFVNYYGFIPTQFLILVFLMIAVTEVPRTKLNLVGIICIAIYTLSLGAAAVFPCDFECRPIVPTKSHEIHMLSAIAAYLSAALSICIISAGLEKWAPATVFRNIGFTLSCIILLSFVNLDADSKLVGLIQRLLEASIFIWLMTFGCHIKSYCEGKIKVT